MSEQFYEGYPFQQDDTLGRSTGRSLKATHAGSVVEFMMDVTDKQANPTEFKRLEKSRGALEQELTARDGKPGTSPEVPSETEELYKRHQEKLKAIKAKKAKAARDDPDLAYLLEAVDAYNKWGEREKVAHEERNKEHSRAYDEGIFAVLFMIESAPSVRDVYARAAMDVGSQKIMAIVKEVMEDPAINRCLEVFVKVEVKKDDRRSRTKPHYEMRAHYPFPVTYYRQGSQQSTNVAKGWSFEDIYKDVDKKIPQADGYKNSAFRNTLFMDWVTQRMFKLPTVAKKDESGANLNSGVPVASSASDKRVAREAVDLVRRYLKEEELIFMGDPLCGFLKNSHLTSANGPNAAETKLHKAARIIWKTRFQPSPYAHEGSIPDRRRLKTFALLSAGLLELYNTRMEDIERGLATAKEAFFVPFEGEFTWLTAQKNYDALKRTFPTTVPTLLNVGYLGPGLGNDNGNDWLETLCERVQEVVQKASEASFDEETFDSACEKGLGDSRRLLQNTADKLPELYQLGEKLTIMTSPELLAFCFCPHGLSLYNVGAHPQKRLEENKTATGEFGLSVLLKQSWYYGSMSPDPENIIENRPYTDRAAGMDLLTPQRSVDDNALKTVLVLTVSKDSVATTKTLSDVVAKTESFLKSKETLSDASLDMLKANWSALESPWKETTEDVLEGASSDADLLE